MRRLLHPFMPFVTEELWQRLPGRQEQTDGVASIMIASYPAAQSSWADPTTEAELALILDVVKAARSLRSGQHMAARMGMEGLQGGCHGLGATKASI